MCPQREDKCKRCMKEKVRPTTKDATLFKTGVTDVATDGRFMLGERNDISFFIKQAALLKCDR